MKYEEYKSLRDEILTHFHISNNFYLSSIVATGVIYGFAFNKDIDFSPYIILIPILILTPTMLSIAFRNESVIRIATYIQVFYNEKENIEGWESRLHKLSHNINKDHWIVRHKRAFYSSSPFFLCLLSLGLFIKMSNTLLWFDYLVVVILGILSMVSFYKMINVEKKRDIYLKYWREILSNE